MSVDVGSDAPQDGHTWGVSSSSVRVLRSAAFMPIYNCSGGSDPGTCAGTTDHLNWQRRHVNRSIEPFTIT
jgi:hypothetical protein